MRILFLFMVCLGPILPMNTASAAPERFPQKLSRLTGELNLTADQKTQLQKIHEDYYKSIPDKKKAMIDARNELQEALRGSKSDADCQNRFDELEKKQSDFGRARFLKILAVRSILTPEQRQKFQAYDEKDEHEGK